MCVFILCFRIMYVYEYIFAAIYDLVFICPWTESGVFSYRCEFSNVFEYSLRMQMPNPFCLTDS